MCLRVFKSGYLIVFWSAAGVYLILSVGDLILVFGMALKHKTFTKLENS